MMISTEKEEIREKEKFRHQVAIAGQVSDKETGQTIGGAIVEITEMPEPFKTKLALKALQYGANWKTLSKRPDRTITAIDGCFYFLDLPDGDYKLKATLPGTGTRYGSFDSEKLTVSSTEEKITMVTANMAMPPTAITGKVTYPNDKVVVMAKVQIEGSGEYTFTNDEGIYLLSGLETSTKGRTVKVAVQGYKPDSKTVQLSKGVLLENLDFKLVKLNGN